jgi:uncharacterized protein YciI
MLFAVIARFHQGAEAGRDELHEQFNAHIAQQGPELRIRLGGSLRNAEGARTGLMMLIEAACPENVTRFLQASPYTAAVLYEATSMDVIELEIGSVA